MLTGAGISRARDIRAVASGMNLDRANLAQLLRQVDALIAQIPIGDELRTQLKSKVMAGRPLSQKTAMEFVAAAGINVAGGLVLRQVATALMKLIPVAGSVVGATIASTGTKALGESAIAYLFGGTPPLLELVE